MRVSILINPKEYHYFEVGIKHIQLIIRDASHNINLGGDVISDITLSRSDIVNITPFKGEKLYFYNQNENAVKIEYQLSDVVISIKEQRYSEMDTITVDQVLEPITIKEIQTPVKVEVYGEAGLNVTGTVAVETPKDPLKVHITGSDIDMGSGGGGSGGGGFFQTGTHEIDLNTNNFFLAGNEKRSGLLFQAKHTNTLLIKIGVTVSRVFKTYVELNAGDSVYLPLTEEIKAERIVDMDMETESQQAYLYVTEFSSKPSAATN